MNLRWTARVINILVLPKLEGDPRLPKVEVRPSFHMFVDCVSVEPRAATEHHEPALILTL